MRLRRRRALATTLLATVLLAIATALAGCATGPDRTVDGWLIGPPRTCDDLSLAADRCEMLRLRALSYAEQEGGHVASSSMHETRKAGANGQPVLLDLGTGAPDAVLLVRHADGSERVALMGCFQPRGPNSPTDPSCP